MAFTKIAAAGIGSTELVTLHSLEVLNNATVGGVLTYEDVTNVDSVGLITARNGIVVGSGITLSKDGDIFATGVTTSTTFVGNLTGNVTGNISGGTVAGSTGTFSGAISGTTGTFSGAISGTTGTFSGAVSGTTGTFSSAVSGTTGTFSSHVSLGDSDELRFGDDTDLKLYHDGSNGYFLNSTGNLAIQAKSGEESIVIEPDGRFVAYHDGTEKFSTQSFGIAVDGVATFTKDSADDTTSTLQINGAGMDASDYLYIMSAANNNVNGLTMFLNGTTRGSDGGNSGLTIRNDNGPMSVGANGGYSNTFYTGTGGGIDFSQTSNAGGMSSELFDDYEEGTYTPTDGSGAGLSLTNNTTARYTKIGRMMYVQFDITWPSNSNAATAGFTLPFALQVSYGSGVIGWTDYGKPLFIHVGGYAYVMDNNNSIGNSSQHSLNSEISGKRLIGNLWYIA